MPHPKPNNPGFPTSFRLSKKGIQLIAELSETLGLKRTSVVELALRQLHKRESTRKSEKSEEQGVDR